MRTLVQAAIVALLLAPFLLAFLIRRNPEAKRYIAATLSALLGLTVGSYALYLAGGSNLAGLTARDWLVAIGLAVLAVSIAFPVTLWSQRLWFNK